MGLYQKEEKQCPLCRYEKEILWGERTGTRLKNRFLIGTERRRKKGTRLYIGWDELFHRKVLIYEKIILSQQAEGISEFGKLGENLIHLDSVEEILKVWAVVYERGQVFHILEYPGEITLREVLKETKMLSFEDVELLFNQVAEALQFSHSIGVCHGTLDVDSCYIKASGKAVLGRFQGGTVKADIMALTNLVSCCLLGTEAWFGESLKEKIYLLRTHCPEEWFEVLRDILLNKNIPKTVKRFRELLDGTATIEIH